MIAGCVVRSGDLLEVVAEVNNWDLVGVEVSVGVVCPECGHVQSAETVWADVLYSWYVREPKLEVEFESMHSFSPIWKSVSACTAGVWLAWNRRYGG